MDLGGRAGGGEGDRVIHVVVGQWLASFGGGYRTSTAGVGGGCDQMGPVDAGGWGFPGVLVEQGSEEYSYSMLRDFGVVMVSR